MKYRWHVMVGALLVAAGAVAQTPPEVPEQKRRLIEQKIKLLEMLLNSPAAKGAAYGREAESTTLIEQGRRSIEEARKALAAGQPDEAAKLLDDALKASSAASRKLTQSDTNLTESAQRKTLQDMSEQLDMYRASLNELAKDPAKGSAAKDLLRRIDGLSQESSRLAAAGQLGEANKRLAEAYRTAVEEMSRLRAGQEVVLSLKFDTPADEYAYERKRFASNGIMVDMMVAEGRAEGERRGLVDGFVEAGRKLGAEAEAKANAGDYIAAVKLMEQASAQLVRALQAMGLPVF